MAITRSGSDPLNYLNSLRKPEPANQSQYRGVNANSTGGRRDAAFMPRVTGSTTMQPRTLGDFDSKVNPALDARKKSQNSTTYPGMVGYKGPSQNDMQWADRVNQMSNQALDSLVGPNIQSWRSGQSPVNVSQRFSSQPGSIAVGAGAPWPMINSQDHSSTFRIDGGDGVMIPYPAPIDHHKDTQADWDSRYAEVKAGNAVFDLMYPNNPGRQGSIMQSGSGMLGQVQALSQTPRQNSGFSMDGPRQVSASVPPLNASTPPLRRSDVPEWSLNGGVSPETARASQDFNRAAQAPRVNTGKIISDRITENMNNASIQGRQDANDIVDRNLNARMGFYSTPQARRGGFFQRGMGPMAGDAAIMQNQNRPLGDGGPAAYAARSDQENRRRSAEAAMGGASPDGLTRYTPNQDLLSFANQDRAKEDQRISDALGGGTQYRQPMQAMTPAEIQFYRHKMSMASNPQYANRVNQQRADRQEMLDNRREMVRARRAGALEAAGASQQLRNLYAGRGGIGPGMDGVGALMSMGAQQDPAATMGAYGNVLRAQDAPLMQLMNYGNQSAMFDRQAQLERDLMDRATKMAIYSSGMSGPEMELAMQRFNAANNGTPITSPLHAAGAFQPDPAKSQEDNYLAFKTWVDGARRTGVTITPEQESQYASMYGVNLSPEQKQAKLESTETPFDNEDYTGGYVSGAMAPIAPAMPYAAPFIQHFVTNPLMRRFGMAPSMVQGRRSTRQKLQ